MRDGDREMVGGLGSDGKLLYLLAFQRGHSFVLYCCVLLCELALVNGTTTHRHVFAIYQSAPLP